MNWLDSFLASVFPSYQMARMQARAVTAAYDAAKPSRTHKARREGRGPNAPVGEAAMSLREQVLFMEQNTDLVNSVLGVLVSNVVGMGIRPEPTVRKLNGELYDAVNDDIAALYEDWAKHPEVTGEFDEFSAQRMAARSLFRDGEVFLQHVQGKRSDLDHGTIVPYSYELIDASMVPVLDVRQHPDALQGILTNEWGRATNYVVYKAIPNDVVKGNRVSLTPDTKLVSAENMIHLKIVRRIRQLRGVSVFAPVLRRIADIEEIDESERVAARVAAAMTAFIKKGDAAVWRPETDSEGNPLPSREMQIEPGMVWDDLRPGEDVGTITSTRPNLALIDFRNANIRSLCGAVGASFSSVAKDYNGTYSAQRQEMVEQWAIYGEMHSFFVSRCEEPKYRRFLKTAILAGALKLPKDIDERSMYAAQFTRPSMPWIQPLQEANAYRELNALGVEPLSSIIRSRGGNPREVARLIEQERAQLRAQQPQPKEEKQQ